MAGYDKEKDKILIEKIIELDIGMDIKVGIRQYDEGTKKIDLIRFTATDGGGKYRKLGRITFDEWKLINEVVNELKKEVGE